MGFKVTPWDVEGLIDYDKLIKEFGTSILTDDLLEKTRKLINRDLPIFFRRKYFFSHRDYDLVLKDYEQGKGFFLYTGRGPSGKMHLGHIIPFMATKFLQEAFDVNLYIQITDDEKFLFKNLSLEETKRYAYDNILDIIALNFDENKTFIFQDTEYTKIYEIALPLAKKINLSMAKAVFGFNNQTNIGSIFFPALEMAPTFFEKKRALIPAAIDQDPYWRLQRDFAESLGYYKAAALHSKFLPPLTGIEGKMSSSKEETAIFLDDNEEEVKRKIFKYAKTGGQATLKEQREKGGEPEKCVVFQWLKIFFEEDDKKLEERYYACKNGSLTCGECKKYLVEKINAFLKEHRENKEKAEKLVDKFKYDGKLASEMWSFALPDKFKK